MVPYTGHVGVLVILLDVMKFLWRDMAPGQVHLLGEGGHNLEAYGEARVPGEDGQGDERLCGDLGSVCQGVHSQEMLDGQGSVLVGVCTVCKLEIKKM